MAPAQPRRPALRQPRAQARLRRRAGGQVPAPRPQVRPSLQPQEELLLQDEVQRLPARPRDRLQETGLRGPHRQEQGRLEEGRVPRLDEQSQEVAQAPPALRDLARKLPGVPPGLEEQGRRPPGRAARPAGRTWRPQAPPGDGWRRGGQRDRSVTRAASRSRLTNCRRGCPRNSTSPTATASGSGRGSGWRETTTRQRRAQDLGQGFSNQASQVGRRRHGGRPATLPRALRGRHGAEGPEGAWRGRRAAGPRRRCHVAAAPSPGRRLRWRWRGASLLRPRGPFRPRSGGRSLPLRSSRPLRRHPRPTRGPGPRAPTGSRWRTRGRGSPRAPRPRAAARAAGRAGRGP